MKLSFFHLQPELDHSPSPTAWSITPTGSISTALPMPKIKQPERLAPRATSNRNGGRDHLGILGEIKSVHPGEIIGIRSSYGQGRNSGRDFGTSKPGRLRSELGSSNSQERLCRLRGQCLLFHASQRL